MLVAVGLLAAPAAGRTQDCCAIFEPGPLPPLSVNQVVHVPVKVTNTGDVTWIGGGSSAWILSYVMLRPDGSWAAFGPPVLFPGNVAKGESVSLTVRLQAPKWAGTYTVRWFVATSQIPTPGSYYYGSTTFDQTAEVRPSLLYLSALLSLLGGTPSPAHPLAEVDRAPLIASMAGRTSSEITGRVVVGGRRFGADALGKLALNFEDGVEWVYPAYWTDTRVDGEFEISGRVDQPATLQVIRADGAKSNEWPVLFRAVLDYRALRPEVVQLECATAGHTTDTCEVGRRGQRDYLAGYHASHCCINGDSGTDTYALPTLLNGWKYEFLLFKHYGYPDEASASYSGFTPGPAGHTVSVDWGAPLHGYVAYTLQVFVRGPLGVPYR